MLFSPASEGECAEIIEDCRRTGQTLDIQGGNTRAGLGRTAPADAILSTQNLTGVTLYEPAEMVFSARAGTPLRDIEAMLAEKNQILPFEPMDFRTLFGAAGEPTIGGVAATNSSGPRRIMSGAARDHLIGLRLVNGRGEIVKSGGRVMKNVTGLDLVKLNCGAFGTLGFLTEVTFKLLPAPRDSGALVFEGLDDASAIACLCAAMGSPFEVSGAAHLPLGVGEGRAQTVLRIEHFPASVNYRLDRLAHALASYGKPAHMDHAATTKLFADIRDCAPLAEPRERAIWKLSVAPTKGPEVIRTIAKSTEASWFYDWSGGLIWLAVPAQGDCSASGVRAAIAASGGHATLMRAPDAARAEIPVFQPLSAPLMKLTAGIKSSFDPDGVLNVGRMYAGI